ncbi:MAG: hypothetical protein ACHP9Y_00170 [Gammaproteobacteria bacterium]
MKNFSKFSKSHFLKSLVLLSFLPLNYTFASTVADEEIPGFCGGREARIAIVPPHHVTLEPGQHHDWKILNISKYNAKDISVKFYSMELEHAIEVTNNCESNPLAPKQTCTITTTAIGSKAVPAQAIDFEGCNTNTEQGELGIHEGHHLIIGEGDDSCFTLSRVGNQGLLLTNLSASAITFDSDDVTFDGIDDVRVGTPRKFTKGQCQYSNGNWTVPASPDNSCTLPIEAGASAHNTTDADGEIFIRYHSQVGGEGKTAEGCINADKVSVVINRGKPIQVPSGGYDISGKKEVIVRNTGPFAWRNPLITFEGQIEHLKEPVISHACKYGVGEILPGDFCTVLFETIHSDAAGTGVLSASGSNIYPDPTTQEVHVGDVTITLGGADEQHLQYQKIVVSNNFAEGPVRLKNVKWSESLNDQVIWCKSEDLTCAYRSTCEIDEPVDPNKSCSIWIKSINSDCCSSTGLEVKDGTINVTVASADHKNNEEWHKEFRAKRENSLYVTGFFNKAGHNKIDANNIAKWNGTQWSNLGEGLRYGEGRALIVYNGDMVTAGRYANAGFAPNTKNIARWNGHKWSQLGLGHNVGPNRAVNTLHITTDTASNTQILTAGGNFTSIGGQHARHVANWNGSMWRPLNDRNDNGTNGPVYDLANYNQGLYVAGDFSRAGVPERGFEIRANNIAGFVDGEWENLKGKSRFFNGLNRTAYALHTAGDNNLYAAGAFTFALGNHSVFPIPLPPFTRTSHVAVWNGAKWAAVGENQESINNTVHDITSFNQTLYIAGSFKKGGAPQYVAFLNGDDYWQTAGGQIDGTVFNLLSHGDRLYAGGNFGAGIFNNIGYWTGVGQWKEIEGGVTSTFDRGAVDKHLARVKNMLVAHSLTLENHK